MERKDLLSRLADAGEEAIGRLSEAPGADRLAGVANAMRDRVDELQKKVRGLEALEARITELERRLAAVEGKSSASRAAGAPRGTARRRSTTAGKGQPGSAGGAAAKRTGSAVRKSEDAASGPSAEESSAPGTS
jgi:hypothetical protein